MEPNLHFKFNPCEGEDVDEIALIDLGASLVGFDRLVRELIKTTRIKGVVSIRAAAFREGSIIIDALVEIKDFVEELPFETISDLLDFLKISSSVAWETAMEFFNEFKDGYDSLEKYFTKHPVSLGLIAIAITVLIDKAKNYKKLPRTPSDDLPERIAVELHKRIQKHAFKLAFKPIIEDKVSSIHVSPNKNFIGSAKIDQTNFQDYLGENDMILPHLENGSIYDLKGEITSLKSTRGDSLTFQYRFKSKKYNLDLLPPLGETTKNYTDYYKENVNLNSEVIRASLYKKPKLKLINIELQQMQLFDA